MSPRPISFHSFHSYRPLNPSTLLVSFLSMTLLDGIVPRGGDVVQYSSPTSMKQSFKFENTSGAGCAADRNRNEASSVISAYNIVRYLWALDEL